MKNKIVYIQDLNGRLGGSRKRVSFTEVLKIFAFISLGTAVAVGLVRSGNYVFQPKPVKAAVVDTGCHKVGDVYDCTTDATKAQILSQAYSFGIVWHPMSEFEVQSSVEKYSKIYPNASTDVLWSIISVAQSEKYTNLDYLMSLINCESKFKPWETNTAGNTPSSSIDRGVMQFNSHWQKTVTDSCAFDSTCAVTKAIEMLKKGQGSLWVCDAIIKK